MFRSLNQKIILFLLSSLVLNAYGLPQDNQQVMHIKADSSLFNYKLGIDQYDGNVIIDQGTTHLSADRLITKKNAQHQLQEATAYGLTKLAEYSTQPKDNDKILYAKAEMIHLFPLESKVLLEKNVFVQQGENSFGGEIIIYNIKDQIVTAPPTKNGRTTIIIEPKQLS